MMEEKTSVGDGRNRFVPVSELFDLPVFCQPILKLDDPSLASWIDGWAVVPSGNHAADWKTGEAFADIAVRYARAKREPGWISLILATIHYKALHGLMTPGGIEGGFFARLATLSYLGSMN